MMEQITIANVNLEQFSNLKELTFEEIEKNEIETYNKSTGNLKYYDCPKCLNRGDIKVRINTVRLCDCMKIRKANRILAESGMAELIHNSKFENYFATEDWQVALKEKCMNFAKNPSHCLFLGGQSGTGKTHLCSAVCGEFIKQGKALKYVLWRDIVTKLQANLYKDDIYTSIVEDIKNVDVLYIDDLFKNRDNRKNYELEIAFKIINDRDLSNKITIISTEYLISDLIKIDEALAGRIVKMSGEYLLQIGKNSSRNYRLKNLDIL